MQDQRFTVLEASRAYHKNPATIRFHMDKGQLKVRKNSAGTKTVSRKELDALYGAMSHEQNATNGSDKPQERLPVVERQWVPQAESIPTIPVGTGIQRLKYNVSGIVQYAMECGDSEDWALASVLLKYVSAKERVSQPVPQSLPPVQSAIQI